MIRRDDSTTLDLVLTFEGGNTLSLNYLSGVQPTPGSSEAIEFIRQVIQDDHDERVSLKDLRKDFPDDPDGDTDPATESMFWSDPRGRPNDELISRSTIYTVTWDGERYQFSSSRTRHV